MSATNQPISFAARVNAAMKKDPKKALFLTVLLALLLGMWGKMALGGGKLTPRSASAMSKAPALPSTSAPRTKARNTDADALLRDWLDQPLPSTVTRNLFETHLEFFPVD